MQSMSQTNTSCDTLHDVITHAELLSRGRDYSVYKARCGSKYIILKTPNLDSSMFRELLMREYELSSTLSHPSIVTTLRFEEHSPVGPAIAMEYIAGEPLDEYMRRKPSYAERNAILDDIIAGVGYLHHRGILHNDLKPGNIVVTNNGSARIVDFGLSASDDGIYGGFFGGSERFTSPEILRGDGASSVSSDIYSLGALMNYLFEGHHYKRIVARCCNEEPSSRYRNCSALLAAIAAHRRRPMVIVAATILLTIIAIIATPHISNVIDRHRNTQIESQIATPLNTEFERNITAMEQCEYMEFASLYRSAYLMFYVEYQSTLSDAEQRAAERLLSQHLPRLDSLMARKPSITTLPHDEQQAAVDSLNVVANRMFPQR